METVNKLKVEYGKNIEIDLVRLETENSDLPKMKDYKYEFNITSIDGYIKRKYSKDKLIGELCDTY